MNRQQDQQQARNKPTVEKVKNAVGNEVLVQVYPDGRMKTLSRRVIGSKPERRNQPAQRGGLFLEVSPMAGTISLSLSQQFNSQGVPLAGGRLYFFQAGTTTPQSAYQDSGLIIPHANPIILDAAGRSRSSSSPTARSGSASTARMASRRSPRTAFW